MKPDWLFARRWRLASVLAGIVLFLGGCDPTTQATVENGIITASTSLLGAFLQAAIALAQDPNSGL